MDAFHLFDAYLHSWDKKTATYGNFSFISKLKLLLHLTKNMVLSQGCT